MSKKKKIEAPATPETIAPSAANVRATVVALLTANPDMRRVQIAKLAGCSQATVSRIRCRVIEDGDIQGAIDGRVNNSRPTKYGAAWARIREIKKNDARISGRDLWTQLVHDENWKPVDVPDLRSIYSYLSKNQLVTPQGTKIGQRGEFWMIDKVETHGDRRGMDEVYPFKTHGGIRLKVVDVRDNFSGAVYVSPYSMERTAADGRGMDGLEFARVFAQSCYHLGACSHLVLDNGGGQIIADGWLPEIARFCIEMGCILEYEPYGTPTQNSHVERWHRELQSQWSRRMAAKPIIGTAEGCSFLRNCASRETFLKPRWNLPRKDAPGTCFPIKRWKDGDDANQNEPIEAVGRGGTTKRGYIRLHRRVEQYGVIQLHGEDYIRIGDTNVGGKVRIDFQINPGGGGSGIVVEPHGEVLCTFNHRIDEGLRGGLSLCYDVDTLGNSGGDRTSNYVWSQEQYTEVMEKMHKSHRSAGLMRAMAKIKEAMGEDFPED